jgi:hypothetical protein
VTNSIGSHTAYKLVAESKVFPFADLQKAAYIKRAQFLEVSECVSARPFLPLRIVF